VIAPDIVPAGTNSMKLAGFLLLPAGLLLVASALILLAADGPRATFVFAGIGVEILGLVLVARAHLADTETRE
jgi:tellurite resistance protein TehA-like permease